MTKKENCIAVFLAQENFRDEEFFETVEEFDKRNIKFKTVSFKAGKCLGKLGGEAEAELNLDEFQIENFDCLVFVGGGGALFFVDHPKINEILRMAQRRNFLIAAICIAPMILLSAGLLTGKRATVWNEDEKQGKIFIENQVIFTEEDLTVDGKIITANGPRAAKKFGQKIAEKLLA